MLSDLYLRTMIDTKSNLLLYTRALIPKKIAKKSRESIIHYTISFLVLPKSELCFSNRGDIPFIPRLIWWFVLLNFGPFLNKKKSINCWLGPQLSFFLNISKLLFNVFVSMLTFPFPPSFSSPIYCIPTWPTMFHC